MGCEAVGRRVIFGVVARHPGPASLHLYSPSSAANKSTEETLLVNSVSSMVVTVSTAYGARCLETARYERDGCEERTPHVNASRGSLTRLHTFLNSCHSLRNA